MNPGCLFGHNGFFLILLFFSPKNTATKIKLILGVYDGNKKNCIFGHNVGISKKKGDLVIKDENELQDHDN